MYIINEQPPIVRQRFEDVEVGDIGVSSVAVSELRYEAEKSGRSEQNHAALSKFLLLLVVLPYDEKATHVYGEIRVQREKAGTPVGGMDLLIAAHALALDLTLVTHDVAEFSHVPGLRVESWGE